ncbi:MAG: radical SAM family heme chaperone HemW [Cyclobacteriaceae bacterium]
MAGLYVHIPFCKQACYYCDFHFSTQQDNKKALINAISVELEIQKNYLDNELLSSIYFGGGTPSLLSKDEIEKIFDSIHKNFKIDKDLEITLEANPDDLSRENLLMFKDLAVNRLSIGIQSFDEKILRFLNRAHSAKEAEESLSLARECGFNNISLDLIFSIPGQDDNLLRKNIEKTIALSPEHISAYSLTIEEKTVFGKWQKSGKLVAEPDDIAASQMEILMDMLEAGGYDQYEVSNFGKPGFYSQHNSSYWQQKKYLGVGPSAHSYNGISRQFNISSNPLYIKSIDQGMVPYQLETLSRANQINEYLLTTLRTSRGSDLNLLLEEFDFDLLNENKTEIENYFRYGMLKQSDNFLLLTKKGRLLADKIASDLFTDD